VFTVSVTVFFVLMAFWARVSASVHPEFLSFLIVLDEPGYFDELKAWLEELDYHNFTFAVYAGSSWDTDHMGDYWLNNSTRLNTLKEYGTIIPETYWMQVHEPSERSAMVDTMIAYWINIVGYAPKGLFDYEPDTYTVNYCETRGLQYVTGYCFDQYAIDWWTERGGWQLPYYASRDHILVPNNSTSGGVVVLPHQLWDWVSSFTVTHNLHTHPLSVIMACFDGNVSLAKNYVLQLIDRSMKAEPFGYVSVQFEWVWHYTNDLHDDVADWIRTLLNTTNYSFITIENFVDWYKSEYEVTPNYSLTFESPYDSQQIEWFYCRDFRVARMGDQVISYIEYGKQKPDKFLTSTFTPNTTLSPHLPENCIDDSLNYEIDALGGGEFRSPVRDIGFTYSGQLQDFPIHYVPEISSLVLVITVVSIGTAFVLYVKKKRPQAQTRARY
jgi:hypothetical protein